jgi:hypothetical protein
MERYTPIFSRIVDSSLWIEQDYVVKIFLTMLAKKDSDEIVRGSAFNIASWAKKSEQEVLDALKILSSPDTKRLEPQPFEGRRIEKVEDGWLLLNGEKYQKEMQKINARRRKTEQQAQYRLEQSQMEDAARNGDPTPTVKKPVPPKAAAIDPRAEEIYQLYPRRESKPSALRAISKALGKVEAEDLIHRVQHYAKSRSGQDIKFTPLPASWFNDERYNDDPELWKIGSGNGSVKPTPSEETEAQMGERLIMEAQG